MGKSHIETPDQEKQYEDRDEAMGEGGDSVSAENGWAERRWRGYEYRGNGSSEVV